MKIMQMNSIKISNREMKHSANIMHPYIYLYEMMKIQYDAIIKYEQELEKTAVKRKLSSKS